jgi:hypothetical protein
MNTGDGFQVLLKNTAYRSNECLAAQRERKMYQRSKNSFNARSFVSSYYF